LRNNNDPQTGTRRFPLAAGPLVSDHPRRRATFLGTHPMIKPSRNWEGYAVALDLHLAGWPHYAIGDHFGVTKERARQIVLTAKIHLAYRVFHGVARPHHGRWGVREWQLSP